MIALLKTLSNSAKKKSQKKKKPGVLKLFSSFILKTTMLIVDLGGRFRIGRRVALLKHHNIYKKNFWGEIRS